jgi:hypothetical protein
VLAVQLLVGTVIAAALGMLLVKGFVHDKFVITGGRWQYTAWCTAGLLITTCQGSLCLGAYACVIDHLVAASALCNIQAGMVHGTGS